MKKIHLKEKLSLKDMGRSVRHLQPDQTLDISQTFAEEYQQKLYISKDQSEVLGIKKDDTTYLLMTANGLQEFQVESFDLENHTFITKENDQLSFIPLASKGKKGKYTAYQLSAFIIAPQLYHSRFVDDPNHEFNLDRYDGVNDRIDLPEEQLQSYYNHAEFRNGNPQLDFVRDKSWMTFSNISAKDINRKALRLLEEKLSDKIASLIESSHLAPEIDEKITNYVEILQGLDRKALHRLKVKITDAQASLIESSESGPKTSNKLANYTKYAEMLQNIGSTPVNKGARTNPKLILEKFVKADWEDLQIGEFMALFANEQQVESMLKDGNAFQSAAAIDTELQSRFSLTLSAQPKERILGISKESDGGITVNFGGTERPILFGTSLITLTEAGQLAFTPVGEDEEEPNLKINTSNARTFHPDGSVTVADGKIECKSENFITALTASKRIIQALENRTLTQEEYVKYEKCFADPSAAQYFLFTPLMTDLTLPPQKLDSLLENAPAFLLEKILKSDYLDDMPFGGFRDKTFEITQKSVDSIKEKIKNNQPLLYSDAQMFQILDPKRQNDIKQVMIEKLSQNTRNVSVFDSETDKKIKIIECKENKYLLNLLDMQNPDFRRGTLEAVIKTDPLQNRGLTLFLTVLSFSLFLLVKFIYNKLFRTKPSPKALNAFLTKEPRIPLVVNTQEIIYTQSLTNTGFKYTGEPRDAETYLNLQEGDELIRSRSGDDVIALKRGETYYAITKSGFRAYSESEKSGEGDDLKFAGNPAIPLIKFNNGEAIISAARIDTEGLFNLEGKEPTGIPSSSQHIDITPDQLKFLSKRKSGNPDSDFGRNMDKISVTGKNSEIIQDKIKGYKGTDGVWNGVIKKVLPEMPDLQVKSLLIGGYSYQDACGSVLSAIMNKTGLSVSANYREGSKEKTITLNTQDNGDIQFITQWNRLPPSSGQPMPYCAPNHDPDEPFVVTTIAGITEIAGKFKLITDLQEAVSVHALDVGSAKLTQTHHTDGNVSFSTYIEFTPEAEKITKLLNQVFDVNRLIAASNTGEFPNNEFNQLLDALENEDAAQIIQNNLELIIEQADLEPDTQTRYYEMLNKCQTNNDDLNALLKETAQKALSAPAEAQPPAQTAEEQLSAQPARTATPTPVQTARTATPKVKPKPPETRTNPERNPLQNITNSRNSNEFAPPSTHKKSEVQSGALRTINERTRTRDLENQSRRGSRPRGTRH